MATNEVTKLTSAYKTFQTRVNSSIPGRTNQLKAIASRLAKYKPPRPGGR